VPGPPTGSGERKHRGDVPRPAGAGEQNPHRLTISPLNALITEHD
jgi:hypothetical protein